MQGHIRNWKQERKNSDDTQPNIIKMSSQKRKGRKCPKARRIPVYSTRNRKIVYDSLQYDDSIHKLY